MNELIFNAKTPRRQDAEGTEESQRDSVTQPRVARHELPWEQRPGTFSTPTGLRRPRQWARSWMQPLQGWRNSQPEPQGSSLLATLGWWMKSLRDMGRAGSETGAPRTRASRLVFGAWCLFGVWCLVFGVSAHAAVLYQNNFTTNEIGKLPDEMLLLDGGFAVQEVAGNKVLQLPGAPLETFGVLFGDRKSTRLNSSHG